MRSTYHQDTQPALSLGRTSFDTFSGQKCLYSALLDRLWIVQRSRVGQKCHSPVRRHINLVERLAFCVQGDPELFRPQTFKARDGEKFEKFYTAMDDSNFKSVLKPWDRVSRRQPEFLFDLTVGQSGFKCQDPRDKIFGL